MTLTRRDLMVKAGAISVISASGLLAWAPRSVADDVVVDLYVTEGFRDLVDGRKLYLQGFSLGPDDPPDPIPRSVINAITGDRVTFNVTNTLSKPHNLKIDGVVDTGPVAPGETKTVSFDAPAAGAYLYYDSMLAPWNRVLGLHGAMIVRTPTETIRDYLWLFNAFDSKLADRVRRGESINLATLVPDVFTINGRFGGFACEARDTSPRHPFGTPIRIRMVNASTFAKSIHFHGEHPVVVRRTLAQQETIGCAKDTFLVLPQEVVEVAMAFTVPADGFPVNAPGPGETDLEYPVHDHHELTQTLGGGLYPNGMLTELVFEV